MTQFAIFGMGIGVIVGLFMYARARFARYLKNTQFELDVSGTLLKYLWLARFKNHVITKILLLQPRVQFFQKRTLEELSFKLFSGLSLDLDVAFEQIVFLPLPKLLEKLEKEDPGLVGWFRSVLEKHCIGWLDSSEGNMREAILAEKQSTGSGHDSRVRLIVIILALKGAGIAEDRIKRLEEFIMK